MKFKTPAINMLIISMISIFLAFTLFACAPLETEKIDVEREETESISKEEIEELEESEEALETVDYENAQFGAEIKGYIPSFLCTDSDNYIKIEITNTSDFTWKKDGNDSVRIGYHYYGQDVEYSEYDNNTRTLLPNDVEPGESVTVEVSINDITHKGIYVIQIDLVLEGHFWFSAKDVPLLQGSTRFYPCTE